MPGLLPAGYTPRRVTQAEGVQARALGFFLERGLTKAQAAGIVGNLKQESSLNASSPGGYLAQWLGPRLSGLESFAKAKGTAAGGNAEVQLEYIWHELTSTERNALTALRKTRTPAEAATVFSQLYERPGEPNLPNRIKYADEAAGVTPTESGATPIQTGIETGEHALGSIGSLLSGSFWEKFALNGVLLLAGAILVVYGVMVAVRPRERALSVPFPRAVPV